MSEPTPAAAGRVEHFVGLAGMAALALGCLVILKPFIAALLLALILVVATWPAFTWIQARVGGHTTLAASIMTLLLAVGFLVPIFVLGSSLAEGFGKFATGVIAVFESGVPPLPEWLRTLPYVGGDVEQLWHQYADDTSKIVPALRQYIGPVSQWLLVIGGSVGRGLVDLSISVIVAFFFFRDGARGAERLAVMTHKLAGARGERLLDVAERTMVGVVYGILGTALAQGVLAAFGLWLSGVPGAIFLGVLTAFLSFIPMAPPVVWVPATIWLFWSGEVEWGIFMGLWGFFVVSGVDNVIRPYFISLGSALPLLLVYLGVVGGIIGFGFLGLFIGPTLLAIAYTIVREWSHARDDGSEAAIGTG